MGGGARSKLGLARRRSHLWHLRRNPRHRAHPHRARAIPRLRARHRHRPLLQHRARAVLFRHAAHRRCHLEELEAFGRESGCRPVFGRTPWLANTAPAMWPLICYCITTLALVPLMRGWIKTESNFLMEADMAGGKMSPAKDHR